MTLPLLTTKLYIPRLRPNLVARPRLVEQLQAGVERKLSLISAQAGAGKTTLLGEWSAACRPDVCVAWLSLDERDNDPARFLTYLVAALQTVDERIGRDLPPPPESTHWSAIESHLTILINQINQLATERTGMLALVLDDFHTVAGQEIHQALTFLLDNQPANLHLVIATRSDPPLPLSRLRARGQLTELRTADLRFSPAEATAFLTQVMGLTLSPDEIAALSARTEGWITGLQMAALSMQGRDDVDGFIQSFAGSNRFILDYLFEEVFQRQPAEVQSFLLQTSLLTRLTGSLCDALSQSGPALDGATTLQRLEKANLFLVALDDQRQWYRYHQLFADFLQARLRQLQPDTLPTLHTLAAEWYEQHDLLADAVDHALAAADYPRALRLIERTAQAILRRGEMATILSWLDALPEEALRNRPDLCLMHAWLLLIGGRPLERVESRLQDASLQAERIPGQVAALRALISGVQGQTPQALALSEQALDQLPQQARTLRNLVALNLTIPHAWSGDVVTAGRAWADLAHDGQQANDSLIATIATCQHAEQVMVQGQLQRAAAIYRQAQTLALVDEQLPVAGLPLIGLGELSREWNDLASATEQFEQGITLIESTLPLFTIDGHIGLARTLQAQGRPQAARASIEQAEQLAARFDVTDVDDLLVAGEKMRLLVAQDDLQAAAELARQYDLATLVDPTAAQRSRTLHYIVRELAAFALVRLWLATGRPQEALDLLDELLPVAQRLQRGRVLLEIRTLAALAHQSLGDRPAALDSLGLALSTAQPEDFVRLFVDQGPDMARLLYAAAERNLSPEYAGHLLAAFPPAGEFTPRPDDHSQMLIEPLSERELQVLQLLAEGLSNQQIAQQLVLSLATVKWHTSNIYRKLAVRSRTQAVTRARELGTLPPR